MSHELVGLIGIILLFVLLAARMWIALVTAAIGFFGIAYIQGLNQAFTAAGQTPYLFIGKYELAVIPTFVLMGCIVSEMAIGSDLYYTMDKWFGSMRGGLAVATTWACCAFGAITGISTSAMVVMAKVALPEMKKHKYDVGLTTGVIAAASTMGIIIPPSIVMVIYGILTDQSIGKLFMAGIVPGVLEAILYMIAIYSICRFNPQMGPAGRKTGFKEKIVSLRNTWPVLALFLLVMGGIYMGVFTPTEAGAIGAFGATIVAVIMRRFSVKSFSRALLDTGEMTAMILLMMMGVSLFMKFVAVSELPFILGDIINGLMVPRIIVLIIVLLVYIILGCFLPAIMTLMLTIPIIYPVIIGLGYDPIWYGVLMVVTIELAGITPPYGMDVFIMSGVSGVPIGTVYRGVTPFIIADFVRIALIVAFPAMILFIPNAMG
jgi:tripartite ATP-independent transporter DctM subunit